MFFGRDINGDKIIRDLYQQWAFGAMRQQSVINCSRILKWFAMISISRYGTNNLVTMILLN